MALVEALTRDFKNLRTPGMMLSVQQTTKSLRNDNQGRETALLSTLGGPKVSSSTESTD